MKTNTTIRTFAVLAVLLCLSASAFSRAKVQGYAERGGATATISGTTVTISQGTSNRVQVSYPSCTVTVYYAGGVIVPGTLIFSDNAGTIKGNPFSCATDGYWFFYANDGRYDIRFSGTGITVPFTLGDVVASDAQVSIWYNALSYGATGNGTTDDTAALQSVFNLASASGGSVYMPCGNYLVSNTITISGPVRLQGSGICTKISAALTMLATQDVLYLHPSTGYYWPYGYMWEVSYLAVVPNGWVEGGAAGTARDAIRIDTTTGGVRGLRDLRIHDTYLGPFTGVGISAYCSSTVAPELDAGVISDNVIYNGILLNYVSDSFRISRNQISGTGTGIDATYFSGAGTDIIDYNQITTTGTHIILRQGNQVRILYNYLECPSAAYTGSEGALLALLGNPAKRLLDVLVEGNYINPLTHTPEDVNYDAYVDKADYVYFVNNDFSFGLLGHINLSANSGHTRIGWNSTTVGGYAIGPLQLTDAGSSDLKIMDQQMIWNSKSKGNYLVSAVNSSGGPMFQLQEDLGGNANLKLTDNGGIVVKLDSTGPSTLRSALNIEDNSGVTQATFNVFGDSYITGGNFGVGTKTPAFNLQVSNTGTVTTDTVTTSATGASRNYVHVPSGAAGITLYGASYVGNNNFGVAGANTTEFYSGLAADMYIGPSSHVQSLHFMDQGYIGGSVVGGMVLGTATGGAKGTGTLNISGDIYKNNTAYNNPDYVFDLWVTGKTKTTYKGPIPIKKLESYLRANRHLPGISRESSGMFERGDMLLEKIEELTLYIIDLQKQIDQLKVRTKE